MKRLSIISIITAAVAFGFASCDDNAEEFKKGAPDKTDCYGVYFPAQKTVLTLDPSEPTIDTVFVARTNTEGAITVPYLFNDESQVFKASELKFEDGQTESYIVLKFDSAQVGVTYTCSIILDDPDYASQYTSNAIAIDISVTRDKWNSLGVGSYCDIFFLDTVKAYPVEILQNDKDRTKFRIMHPYDAAMAAGNGYSAASRGVPCEYIPLYLLKPGNTLAGVSVTESGLVYFEESSSGYYHGSYGQTIMLNHPAEFSKYRKEEAWLHNKVLQYQDNGLPAGIQLAPYYYMNGVGGWDYTTDDGMVTIIFPGAVLTDYTLTLKADYADAGEQDVAFVFGADVAFAKYATYDGVLNATQVDAKVEAILAGQEATAKTVDSTSVITLTFPATGDYTLVAVAYDADSVPQTTESLVLNYVAAADSVPVDIFAELVSTKKYERMIEGLSSDNYLEFTIYGSDITGAFVGVFPSNKFNSDPKGYIEDMKELDEDDDNDVDYALDAEAIELINATGYTDIWAGLNPGLEYTLVVIATNGYEEKIALATATTTGEPLPIFMDFDYTDFDDNLCPATAAGYNGTYEFFARVNDASSREKVSSVKLTALNDSIVNAKGFMSKLKKFGFNDSINFFFEDGYLYSLATTMDKLEGGSYAAALRYYNGSSIFPYTYDYLLVGGYVCEDNIAFVDCATGVNLTGWVVSAYSDNTYATLVGNFASYEGLLLAKPGQYDDFLAPLRSNRLNELSAALNAPRTNYVETELGYVRSTIKNFKNAHKINACGTKAGLDIAAEPRSVEAKVVAVKAYQISERPLEEIIK